MGTTELSASKGEPFLSVSKEPSSARLSWDPIRFPGAKATVLRRGGRAGSAFQPRRWRTANHFRVTSRSGTGRYVEQTANYSEPMLVNPPTSVQGTMREVDPTCFSSSRVDQRVTVTSDGGKQVVFRFTSGVREGIGHALGQIRRKESVVL